MSTTVSAPESNRSHSNVPHTRHELRHRHRVAILTASAIITVPVIIIATVAGTANVGINDFLHSLRILVTGSDVPVDFKQTFNVVTRLRLPRVLLALVAGALLGLSGVVMQGLLRNPLVSPDTLGVSHAAAFGAALAILLGLGNSQTSSWIGVTACALISALLCTALILALSTLKKMAPVTLILLGVALTALFAAATSATQFIADEQQLAAIVHWTFGTVNDARWFQVGVCGLLLLIIYPLLMWKAKDLNSITFAGDDAAKSLGVNVTALRFGLIVAAVIGSSVVVSFCGTIGFVALVGPHIARLAIGTDFRYLLPFTAVSSGLLLVLSDLLGRLAFSPIIVPVGIVTAVVGAPVFISLILSKKGMQ